MSNEMKNDFSKACLLAFEYHDGQIDKLGEPYVAHLVRVVSGVQNAQHRVVAMLHDIVEDTDMTIELLETHFDNQIVQAVDAMTKRNGESYNAYLGRVKNNQIATAVKLADIADNTSPRRTSQLDDETRHRLRKKYAFAISFLTEQQEGSTC